ncbi:hypothetical protein SLS55_001971 [Diplodia seriata]|uniref:Uncharacterized protein n=1 Tax=Diplodia seriata TaxID=420778 RepID=A0ABR3CRP6_9PEZI
MAALQNHWYHRRVADAQAKACWICFKPSSSVLITPDNKDFFYICPGHLKDRGFCEPDADEAAALAEKKKKDEMDLEIKKIKEEYEEKQRRKKERRKEKEADKGKDKEKDKEDKKDEDNEDKKDEKERDDKVSLRGHFAACVTANLHQIQAISNPDQTKADDGPRIFTLHKYVHAPSLNRSTNPPERTTRIFTALEHPNFYQMRIRRIRDAEAARRNKDRLANPSTFPSVPKGDL